MSNHTDKPGFFARLLRFNRSEQTPQDTEPPLTLGDLQKQIKRLAKEIYKGNALTESALDENRETLDALREQRTNFYADEIAVARLELAQSMLPVVDAIQAGLKTGENQLRTVALHSSEAAQMLEGWLGGQRLLRDRLQRLLEVEGIHVMQPMGEAFDPYRHVAVKTISRPDRPGNTVIAVERDGYLHNDKVVRFAEVVVNRVTELSVVQTD
jgi:molecular chaperone GrpE (heat shock protein)